MEWGYFPPPVAGRMIVSPASTAVVTATIPVVLMSPWNIARGLAAATGSDGAVCNRLPRSNDTGAAPGSMVDGRARVEATTPSSVAAGPFTTGLSAMALVGGRGGGDGGRLSHDVAMGLPCRRRIMAQPA